MPFSEDDAVEIASASKEAQAFEAKHPDCVWNVEKMKPKDVEVFIKKNAKLASLITNKPTPPKALWLVELEELDAEKLTIIVSPDTKKVVDAKTEKLEAEVEEEEEEAEEEEE